MTCRFRFSFLGTSPDAPSAPVSGREVLVRLHVMNFDAFWGNKVGKMDHLRSEIGVRKRGPVSEMKREGKSNDSG